MLIVPLPAAGVAFIPAAAEGVDDVPVADVPAAEFEFPVMPAVPEIGCAPITVLPPHAEKVSASHPTNPHRGVYLPIIEHLSLAIPRYMSSQTSVKPQAGMFSNVSWRRQRQVSIMFKTHSRALAYC
jgi:hypothetical protein